MTFVCALTYAGDVLILINIAGNCDPSATGRGAINRRFEPTLRVMNRWSILVRAGHEVFGKLPSDFLRRQPSRPLAEIVALRVCAKRPKQQKSKCGYVPDAVATQWKNHDPTPKDLT